jgi:hypothetical protein
VHSQFIGEVLDVKAEESVLGEGGAMDVRLLRTLIYIPDVQEYFSIGEPVAKVFSAGKAI